MWTSLWTWLCLVCVAPGAIVALSAEVAEAQTIHYACAGGPLFVVYSGSRILVVYQDVRYGLQHQPTIPGARYSNGSVYWWWWGNQGTLGHESGAVIAYNCQQTGSPQPQPGPVPPSVLIPSSSRNVVINQASNLGQVYLNPGNILRVRLSGGPWTVSQLDTFLLHYLGTGGFLLGQELIFRAVNPGAFNLLIQHSSGNRFAVGVTIGYGSGPAEPRERDVNP